MAFSNYPTKYLRFNEQNTKNIRIVVDIDGIDYLSSSAIFTRVRYGDPGVDYGDIGLVYGGLRRLTSFNGRGFRDILSLDSSSLTISQRLEPEQGRGAVTTLSLAFIDKDQYMTQVVSPGIIVDEILGREVKVYLGFEEVSFPEDYLLIFRGRISDVTMLPGVVVLQTSDPNIIRRQNVFFCATTKLNGAISNVDTTINVDSNGDFFQEILGPNGMYDPAISTYFKVDDEFIQYTPAGFGTNQFTSVTRGARGTTAKAHDDQADVSACIQIQDHAIDMALKIMLSGWGGPFVEDVPISHIVYTGDPVLLDQPRAIILTPFANAKIDYGLEIGDYVIITGDVIPANNITGQITRFETLFDEPNRIIYIDQDLVASPNSPATLSFRSQYDTYPDLCGVKLKPTEVDVEQHLFIKDTFLFPDTPNSLRIFITEQDTAKTFIESEVYLPTSLYSLTRQGKLSVGITKPPLADQRLIFLNTDNVIDPQNIKPNRGINNRKFFNEIIFQYDADDQGEFAQTQSFLDSESLSLVGINKQLPIKSKGVKTDLGSVPFLEKRASFLLSRYKRGATILTVKVNYKAGTQIEAGDVVALQDANSFTGVPELQIPNFNTGIRNFGVQLMEVIDRTFNIKEGNVSITLVSGIGSDATDRFATVSPSSRLTAASTVSQIVIQDSFGAIFPGDEPRKWRDYVGQKIHVHNEDYSLSQETTLTSLDPINNYKMNISPQLGFTPGVGFTVDIPDYPDSPDVYPNMIYKQIHAFFDPQVIVVTGIDNFSFTVSSGDITKFFVGSIVRVHSFDYSIDSLDKKVSAVDTGTNTVTVSSSLGFTPAAGQEIDLIGFRDKGGAYRIF